jgi:hypothetical protein
LFLCYSQYNQDEFLGLINDRIVPGIKRRDPSLKDFTEAMNEFVQECKSNPTKDFLLFLVFASHGYHVAGFQEVLSPFLDNQNLTHEFIPVENIVRGYLKEVKNAYCAIHFACCRAIKTISDLEVD